MQRPGAATERLQSFVGWILVSQQELSKTQTSMGPATLLLIAALIVNVGIDAVSYTLAAQDSLRSPLYRRLAAAFGSAQARIFDTGSELVDALRRGELDVAYNVPLSEAGIAGSSVAYQIVVPQDYALGLPWTMFVPASSSSSYGAHVVSFLLSPEGQRVISEAIWHENVQQYLEVKEQRIHLGAELLVYLDSIKRSNFLDAWFELVTSP